MPNVLELDPKNTYNKLKKVRKGRIICKWV